ncbi:MAG TPA: hypothetical protein PLV42_04495 [bacterium]|nr:hypothetical protein [bacterium]
MRKLLLISLFVGSLVLLGCGSDAEKTYVLTLNFQFDPQEAADCTSYLPDNGKFSVTVYNETFETRKTHELSCTKEAASTSIDLTSGTYYVTIELLDATGNIKSWSSTSVDLLGDKTLNIPMRQYRGGFSLSWSKTLCSSLGVSLLKISALQEGDPVSAIVWGQEKVVSELPILCQAESFAVNNIAAGKYALTVAGYRTDDSERVRAAGEILEFTLVDAQNTPISLKDHLDLVVSDLSVTWDFDSKSITSCSDAGITIIRATLTREDDTITQEMPCDYAKRTMTIYDVPAGEYTVTVDGLDAGGSATFTGQATQIVEKGKIAKNSYKIDILIKQE